MAMPKMAWAVITPTKPSGNGTADSPYQIGNPEELYWFAALVNGTLTDGTAQNLSANAVLTADITVNTGVLNADGTLASNTSSFRVWTPIGTSSNLYKGTFDGQGHEVIGLYFNDTSAENVGMFGCSDGTVKNVGVVDSYFSGNMRVGGVCGYNYNGISNCYNRSTVNGVSNVGGIVGVNWGSECTIRNCYNTGSISASNYGAGGIAGYNYYGTITDCYSSAAISAPKTVGGICGATDGKSTIKNCYHNSRYYTGNAIGTTSSSGTEENVSAKTEAQFASGEVCYLLNGSTSDGAWGQTLSGTNKQDYPVFGGDKVYYGYADCDESKDKTYSNTKLADTRPGHNFNEHGFCTVCGAYQPATDSDSNGVYEIGNAGQLYWFAALVNGTNGLTKNTGANAILTADITVNSGVLKADGTLADDTSSFTEWTPMGDPPNQPYNGTFEGANHTISGLYFNNSTTNHVGLFGGICGTVMNVGVIDSYFKGQSYVGGVCGMIKNYGTITNCYNKGAVSGYREVGGVCGWMYSSSTITKSTITDCYNTGKVSGKEYVGGVCGSIAVYDSETATVTNCYNTGSVSGTSAVGGVCGINGAFFSNSTATVNKCYNTGAVSGSNEVGGVCGRNTTSPSYSTATVINCYNIGAVSGYSEVGGVCGNSAPVYDPGQNNAYTYIKNCYNIGTVSGTSSVGGVCGSALFDFQPGTSYYSKIENCYYNTDIYSGYAVGNIVEGGTVCTKVEGKTSAKFRSGEVAYLLNGSVSDGSQKWYQTIGTDGAPVLDNTRGTVYYATLLCGGEKNVGNTYANTQEVSIEHDYNENGFCTVCGAYQPATLTTDKYDINGDNTKDEVYEIGNAGQLYWFAALVNGTDSLLTQNKGANAVLTADITVNTGVLNADGTLASDVSSFRVWTIIGNSSNKYTGTFDGQNYTISGLYFNNTSIDYVGLFGFVGGGGEISNVGVVDSYFKGNNYTGGVCGKTYSTITNCYNTGAVSGSDKVGGVCGESFCGEITNCYNTGAVSGSNQIGGVCGFGNGSTITNCYFDSNKYSGNAVGKNSGTVSENVIGKTTTQFASGEVAYLLSLGCTVGDGESEVTYDGSVWGQTIGTDKYPVLGGLPVYYRDEVYTNTYGILTEGTQTITASNEPLV